MNDLEQQFFAQPNDLEQQFFAQESLAQANQALRDLGVAINRGRNLGGLARNIAMGTIPGTAEAEATLRATKQAVRNIDPTVSAEKKTDESWGESYDRYLQNARESREGYMSANPTKAIAAQVGGGIAGSLLPFGVATKLGLAGKLGAVGRSTAGRGLVAGGTSGAAFGFGNAQGGLENRLKAAGIGAGLGAVTGGIAAPLVLTGAGALNKAGARMAKGYGKELTQPEIESFVLSDALQPNIQSRSFASTLGRGSAAGAKDIENAAYQLSDMYEAMQGMNIPGAYAGKTAGGTTAQQLLKATEHPSMTLAKQNFGDFVANVPTVENPTRPVQAILEKLDENTSAINALSKNEDLFKVIGANGEVSVLNPGSFEYWQTAQQILNNQLPKKYTPSRLTGAKKEIYDAVQEIKKVREKLFPGTKKINAEYASAVQDQRVLNNEVSRRLKVMKNEEMPESMSGGIVRMIEALSTPSYRRGLAREIIKEGQRLPVMTPTGYKVGSSATDAILRMLETFAK